MKNDYFIYKYEWEDGSVYVGQSSTTQHRYGIICQYIGCPKVYPKMKKHPNFDKCILKDGINELEVDDFERYYIALYNSYCGDNGENKLGLNCDRGGQKSHNVSNETRKKMSEHSFIKGKHLSEETKIKLSKPVLQYSKDGEFIKEWDSIKYAQKELGISHISKCCRNKYGFKTAGGYIWRYKDGEYNKEQK